MYRFWRQRAENKRLRRPNPGSRQSLKWFGRDLLWIGTLALVTFVLYECGGTRHPHSSPLVKVHTGAETGREPPTQRSTGVYRAAPAGAKHNHS